MNLHNIRILSHLLLLLILYIPHSTSSKFQPAFLKPITTTRRRNRQLRLLLFAPCPAPRFDTFADNNLGPWQDYHTTNDTDAGTRTKRGEVEEVMRSCGGAVQGIKEVPLLLSQPLSDDDDLTDDNSSERLYHNRADDGFLFFDCGSYVSLPTKLSSPSKNIACCLSIPTTTMVPGRSLIRMILTTDPCSFQILVRGDGGETALNRGDISSDGGVDENEEKKEMDLPLTCAPQSILWEKGTICRMSSPGQTWMLQRAMWERYTRDDDDYGEGKDTSSSSVNQDNEEHMSQKGEAATRWSKIEGWITTFKAEKDHVDESVVIPVGTSTILQMGSRCLITKETKAMFCFYDENNELKGVSLHEGLTMK